MSAPGVWSVTARWIFPVDQPPIPNGVMTIHGIHIGAVDRARVCKADLDLGNVAILPGLVNAHTHLDLGGLRGKLPLTADFTQWLRAVVNYRRTSTVEEWKQAIRAGVEESLLAGTTELHDISHGGHSLEPLHNSALDYCVYYELIGLTKTRARKAWQEAESWWAGLEFSKNRAGFSPHACYSVRKSLFKQVARYGYGPFPAIHFAETPLEQELLQHKSGPLREFLDELDAWDGKGLVESLESILDMVSPGSLLIHANYLTPDLIQRMAGRRVVYCPRTHRYFSHAPHPFRELLAAGAKVLLGTDSLASNPDLSILAEMRFLWQNSSPPVAGDTILKMGTHRNRLMPGWGQQWIAVALPDVDEPNPYRLLFESSLPVRHSVIRGSRWAVRDGHIVKPAPARPDC